MLFVTKGFVFVGGHRTITKIHAETSFRSRKSTEKPVIQSCHIETNFVRVALKTNSFEDQMWNLFMRIVFEFYYYIHWLDSERCCADRKQSPTERSKLRFSSVWFGLEFDHYHFPIPVWFLFLILMDSFE